MRRHDADKTAAAILNLDEPWRCNFLEWIAHCANGRWESDTPPATLEELRALFEADTELCLTVVELYCRWTHSDRTQLWSQTREAEERR